MAIEEVESLLDRCEAALDQGQPEQAVAFAEKAIHLAPELGEGFFLLGEALLDLGEHQRAVEAFRQADVLAPEEVAIIAGLGISLFELAQLDEAKTVLRRALRLDPNLADVHYLLSVLQDRQGNKRSAQEHMDHAVELAPETYHQAIEISREQFDSCVEQALGELPPQLKTALCNTPVMVEPFPSQQDLQAENPPLDPEILGLFRGPALMDRTVFDPWTQLPGEIVLFQHNLQRLAKSRQELVEEIRITVLHEVGHLLGLDEEDLEERGWD
jgi:predicted Zn-dependent protease with MMP-like domain